MIKSMTGFGRGEYNDGQRKIVVEIKSVNHRYLDFNIRMPKKLYTFEGQVRSVLKDYMLRGKVDVFITMEEYGVANTALHYNEQLAGEYLGYLKTMADKFEISYDVSATTLSRYPEVFTMEEAGDDPEELLQTLLPVIKQAGESFVAARVQEGESLKNDLKKKLQYLKEQVTLIEERAPKIMEAYRQRLYNKLKELMEETQIDENRLATEMVLFSDKMCTDEETVRLNSHIDNMLQVLEEGQGIGRKLDFIAQEMNREANTILSKANDMETSQIGIELKTEIEKIREQIQNIE